MRHFFVLVTLLLLSGCTDEMFGMLLNDGTPVLLDWTTIGGAENRSDRLTLTADGYAFRNKGGNLFTYAPMTDIEHEELERLRSEHGRLVVDEHTPPRVAHPSAHRLRFDGRGQASDIDRVRAFADEVLLRLAPEALIDASPIVVAAVVEDRGVDGSATVVVQRVLRGEHSVRIGERIDTVVRDGRAGAGGAVTVFAVSNAMTLSYLKLGVEDAEALLR